MNIEQRLAAVEGTVRWMRWIWMTVGTATAFAAAGWLFSKL